MSISKVLYRLCFLAGVASLIGAAGCGGGGPVIIPHQTGNFSNASFKGSYVFQIHGFISSSGAPYREVGVITADGNGNITGGTDGANTVGTAGAIQSSASLTGTYSIANDGTGSITLNSTALGSLFGISQITFAVTLASTSQAQLIEADTFADGAGAAELQDPTAVGTTPSGTFVFGLHDDSNAQSASESEVGVFTISGTSVTGNMDRNLMASSASLTLNGSFTAPSALGVGTATFTDSASSSTSFIYYIVNSRKFEFLTSDVAVGSGSAEAQTGTVSAGLSGTYVFGSRGDDLSGGIAADATVGEFTASGATFSSGALDAMQDGNYSGVLTLTGAPVGSPSAQGRVEVKLTVTGSAGPTVVFWLVNPSRAFFLDENGGDVEDGTADLQTTSSFSAAGFKGQFAIVMDGVDFVNSQAIARVGTLQFDGTGKITLVEVVNASATQTGAQSPGALAGNYQVGGSGRITTQITNSNGGGPDLVMYAISGSQAYALQTDAGENTSGVVELQQ